MSHAFRGEADSLRQHHTNYCLLKENLQAHYTGTIGPNFHISVHSSPRNRCVGFVSCPEQAADEKKVLFSFNLTVI